MERIDDLIRKKRAIFNYYQERLSDLPLRMNPEPKGTVNGYWMPTVVWEQQIGVDRSLLLKAFAKDEIDGRVFFWPLSTLAMFGSKCRNPISQRLHANAINLPSYHDMTRPEMERVIGHIRVHFTIK